MEVSAFWLLNFGAISQPRCRGQTRLVYFRAKVRHFFSIMLAIVPPHYQLRCYRPRLLKEISISLQRNCCSVQVELLRLNALLINHLLFEWHCSCFLVSSTGDDRKVIASSLLPRLGPGLDIAADHVTSCAMVDSCQPKPGLAHSTWTAAVPTHHQTFGPT